MNSNADGPQTTRASSAVGGSKEKEKVAETQGPSDDSRVSDTLSRVPHKIVPNFEKGSVDYESEVLCIQEYSSQNKRNYEEDLSQLMGLTCERRFKWGTELEFIVASIAYLVGYDATFSFLRLFESVGVTMVIPLTVILIVYGIPVLYLELALGQYASLDSSLLFQRLTPILATIGYMSWGIAFMGIISSQSIMVMCVDLIISSIWFAIDNYIFFESCHKYYNTEDCFNSNAYKVCNTSAEVYYNGGCCMKSSLHPSQVSYIWGLHNNQYMNRRKDTAHQYMLLSIVGFYDNKITENLSLHSLFWMLLGWVFLAIVARRGIRFVIKVSYISMASMIMLIIIIFGCGIYLGGFELGVLHFFSLRFHRLVDVETWLRTFAYVSICLKLGQGGLITIGSYNSFHTNFFRNMLYIVAATFVSPIFIAFSLISLYIALLKAMAHGDELNSDKVSIVFKDFVDIDGVAMTTSALLLLESMGGAVIMIFAFSVLFLCLGNQMMRMVLLINSMVDQFKMFKNEFYRRTVIAAICAGGCWVNMCFCSTFGPGLYYTLTVIIIPFTTAAVAMFEVMTITYAYGSKRMFTNIHGMLFGLKKAGRDRGMWRLVPYFNGCMLFCWKYATPLSVLIFISLSIARTLIFMSRWPLQFAIAHIASFVISFIMILTIPAYALARIYKARRRKEPISMLFHPHLLLWGPRTKKDRILAQKEQEKWRVS